MGFQYWYEGLIFIFFFSVIIGFPCFMVVLLGTKMINELGNFPTKAAKIQTSVIWKLLIVEVVSGIALWVFFRVFS